MAHKNKTKVEIDQRRIDKILSDDFYALLREAGVKNVPGGEKRSEISSKDLAKRAAALEHFASTQLLDRITEKLANNTSLQKVETEYLVLTLRTIIQDPNSVVRKLGWIRPACRPRTVDNKKMWLVGLRVYELTQAGVKFADSNDGKDAVAKIAAECKMSESNVRRGYTQYKKWQSKVDDLAKKRLILSTLATNAQ